MEGRQNSMFPFRVSVCLRASVLLRLTACELAAILIT